MSNNAHDLTNRLLNALDSNYNVVDMQAVNEIICILEKINITKELLETTRLGKHVNELRRRTGDAALARRAKVLVKRWRDLVIPTVASPKNNNTGSNRSSAERQVRRLGGTPLTSPALSRLVVSPAVASPRPPSRPAWGGYESDSQDVILVDDDPSPVPLPGPVPLSPAKRAPSPEPVHDDKKAKRDKKPKKRKGHSRAGSEAASTWGSRNGDAHKNGCKPLHKLLPRGKKVKTTQELLEEIQSRGNKPASPDVLLVEPDAPAASPAASPARNGGSPAESAAVPPAAPSPPLPPRPASSPSPPACVCGDDAPLSPDSCPAASRTIVLPWHVTALHHAWLPGVNGTLAPPHESQFHTRSCSHPEHPDLFASVVPLYKYQDYAADRCVKNMVRVPLCSADEKPSVSDSDSVKCSGDNVKCSGDNVKCSGDSVKCSEDSVKFSGDSLYAMCSRVLSGIPYNYGQAGAAPVLSLRGAEQRALLAALAPECAAPRDALGRPERAPHFAEWHECAALGDLVALPYVVID